MVAALADPLFDSGDNNLYHPSHSSPVEYVIWELRIELILTDIWRWAKDIMIERNDNQDDSRPEFSCVKVFDSHGYSEPVQGWIISCLPDIAGILSVFAGSGYGHSH
jgi:hypothetical protein